MIQSLRWEKYHQRLKMAILLLVFAYAAYLRFWGNPISIYLDFDAPGYMLPVLDFLNDGTLSSYDGRAYPYPLFLLVVLAVFKNLNAVVVIQHILALGGGLVFVFLANAAGSQFKQHRRISVVFSGISLLVISMVLFNGHLILFEKSLRPEGLLMPYLSGMALSFRLLTHNKAPRFYLLLTMFFSFLGMLLWPRFVLSFIVFSAFSVGVFVKHKQDIKIRPYLLMALALVGVIAVVRLPETLFRQKSDGIYRYFVFQQFFYSNAHAVYKQLDRNNSPLARYAHVDALVKEEIAKTRGSENAVSFPVLGYDVDKLQYETAGPVVLQQMLAMLVVPTHITSNNKHVLTHKDTLVLRNLLSAELHNYFRAWTIHLCKNNAPDLIYKSVRQFVFVSFHKKGNLFGFTPAMFFQSGFIVWPHKETSINQLHGYGFEQGQSLVLVFPKVFTSFYNILGHFIRFVLLLFFPVFLYLLIRKKTTNYLWLMLLFYLAAIFPVSVAHTFEHVRYSQSLAVPALLLFFALCFKMLSEIAALVEK